MDEGKEPEQRQARAQVLTAKKVESTQAVLWMQMRRDAQVAAFVDSTSRTLEVCGPTRQVLALTLYMSGGRSEEAKGRRVPGDLTQTCKGSGG